MTKISNQYSLTNVLFADAVNGRVGIGTETPTEKLTVIGNIKIDNGAADGGQLTLASSGYSNWNIDNYSGSLRAYYNATEFLRITSSGYFSINSAVTSNGLVNIKQIGSARYGGINIYDDAGNTFLGLGNTGSLCVVEANYNTGSYTPLAFYTGGSERMRITSDGTKYLGTFNSSRLQISSSGESMYQYTNNYYIWGIFNDSNSLSIESAFGGNIIFRAQAQSTSSSPTTATERMRITSGGNVGIGTTTPAVKLQIDGTNDQERFRLQNTDSPSYMAFSEQNITMWRPNDSGSAFVIRTQAISGTWTGGGGGIEFRPLNTLRMTIGPTGNIGAPSGTNIYNASDARLKQNISQITYGLDAITALNPVKFNWVDGFEPSEDGKYMLGFVAQEVLEVLPEAVEAFGTNSIKIGDSIIDNPLRVNEKFIIPVLVKAIQEQQLQINELKALLNA